MKPAASVASVALALAALFPSLAYADEAPTKQCDNVYTQAQELEKQGKLLAARDAFQTCLQGKLACKSFVTPACKEGLGRVAANVPSVVFEATEEGGGDLTDVKVSVDGKALAASLDGKAIELDPGAYTFVFQTADGRTKETKALVGEGEPNKRVTVRFGKSGAAPETAPSDGPAGSNPGREPSGSLLKPLGIGATALGLVAVGVGIALVVVGSNNESSAGCTSTNCTVAAHDSFNSAATVKGLGTGLLVGGGVFAVGGVTMWILSPSSATPTPSGSAAGIRWRGVW